MPITTLDGIIAGMRPTIPFLKASQTAEGAGTFHSLWKAAGSPGAGANPPAFNAGSGYVPTAATPGAIPFTNPTAGAFSYLAGLQGADATPGALLIYDRCWACSGLVTNVTTAQNITTPGNVGRYAANPVSVELWGEVYSAPGATGATWTVSYTNQDGTAGRTATYTHPANAESVGQMFPFTLAAGDTGVKSVQSFTCSVSSGTAGDIGLTLVRRACVLPLTNNGNTLDAIGTGFARLLDDSCLSLIVLCSTTLTGNVIGAAVISQG